VADPARGAAQSAGDLPARRRGLGGPTESDGADGGRAAGERRPGGIPAVLGRAARLPAGGRYSAVAGRGAAFPRGERIPVRAHLLSGFFHNGPARAVVAYGQEPHLPNVDVTETNDTAT